MADAVLTTEPTRVEIVRAATLAIDTLDGGFSPSDLPTVKSIVSFDRPTDRQIRCLWIILGRYVAGLGALGVDYAALVPPPPPASPADGRTPVQVRPGTESPPSLANRQGKIIALALGPSKEWVSVGFNYHPKLVGVAQKLPNRKFDKEGSLGGIPKSWVIPTDPTSIETAMVAFKAVGPEVIVEASDEIRQILERGRWTYIESRAESADIEVPTKIPLYPYQRAGVKGIDDRQGRTLLADEMGVGKAQPVGCLVLTFDGWKRIGDLKPGMKVVGPNGKEIVVKGIFPQGKKEIFKVTFSDETSVECCDEHLWNVNTALRKSRGASPKILPLKEIREKLFDGAGNARHYIPMTEPIAFLDKDLPIDPYLLGTLIGNGSLTGRIVISLSDEEACNLVAAALPNGLNLRKHSGYDYNISQDVGVNTVNPLQEAIRNLGLDKYSEGKFIPEIYKFSSVESRISLLQGLMDTDGYVNENGSALQFTTVSPILVNDVQFLIESLGGRAKVSSKIPTFTYKGEKKTGQLAYTLTMNLPRSICPFRLPRKLERIATRGNKYGPTRAIIKVESVGEKEAICISVEGQLYLTEHCIVTHNTAQVLGWMALRSEKALPALVICKSMLKVNWVLEAGIFTNFKCLIIAGANSVSQLRKFGLNVSETPQPGYDLTIVNYDLLSTESPKTWLKMLLNDEKERALNEKLVKLIKEEETKEIEIVRGRIAGLKDERKYAAAELVKAGKQSLDILQRGMETHEAIVSRNRISKVMEEINADPNALGEKSSAYLRYFVNNRPIEEFMKMEWKTLIFDESHYVKETEAQRTTVALKLSREIPHVMCLTGTPILNRPKDLWSQTQLVDPSLFPSFFMYGKEFCGAFQKPAGRDREGNIRMAWDWSGSSNLDKLEKTLRSTIMIRRMKEQVLKELPSKTRSMKPILTEEKEERAYRKTTLEPLQRLAKLKKEREEWRAVTESLSEEERRKFIAEHAEKAAKANRLTGLILDDIEKIKQAAVDSRFEESVSFIMDVHEQEGKILVFASHHATIDRLLAVLEKEGIRAAAIDGRVQAGKREEIKKAFQEGDLEILICGIRAAAEGLTLTAAHIVIMMEMDWHPGIHAQAEDRVHRIGQKMAVTVYYLIAMGTVEEKIARMVDAKREVMNATLGEGHRTLSEDGILDAVLDEFVSKAA